MKSKSLLQIIPAILLSASLAAVAADKPKASPSPAAAAASPSPAAAGKRTANPEAVSKGMLTRLTNQVGLTAAQQTKAKPIIDKFVADAFAVRDDATLDSAAKKAKVDQLRQQRDTDITGILTPVQKKKFAAAQEQRKAQLEAARAKRAAAGAVAPSPTPKAGQ
jgi:Spy/CpxP family protein refolding chaperone